MAKKSTKFPVLSDPESREGVLPNQSIREHGVELTLKPNGDWVYSINVMADGVRIHRVLGPESHRVNLRTIQAHIEKLKSDAREGRLSLPRGRKTVMRFQEASGAYLKRLEEEGGADIPAKRRRIALHLTPHLGRIPLPAITLTDIERYKRTRLAEIAIRGGGKSKPKDESKLTTTKPGTINRELAALSHVLHKAVEWGWLTHLPVKVSLLPDEAQRITYLTVDQCEEVVNIALDHANPLIYPFILIGLQTSMRMSEILRIQREHIDVLGRTIFIPIAKAGARQQPMTGLLANYLKTYLESLPSDQCWLFPSARSKSGHLTTVRKPYRQVISAAGLDPNLIVRHTLRHTAVTHMVQAGVDLPTVMKFSGHKTMAMLERYAHANTAHVQDSMDKLQARLSFKKAA